MFSMCEGGYTKPSSSPSRPFPVATLSLLPTYCSVSASFEVRTSSCLDPARSVW